MTASAAVTPEIASDYLIASFTAFNCFTGVIIASRPAKVHHCLLRLETGGSLLAFTLNMFSFFSLVGSRQPVSFESL